jgi:hypothetical protein
MLRTQALAERAIRLGDLYGPDVQDANARRAENHRKKGIEAGEGNETEHSTH